MAQYTLPVASSDRLGGVKVGNDFEITQDGVLSISGYDELREGIDNLVPTVKEGKQKIASAITDKGVPTDAGETFQTMADNISLIETGGTSSGLPEVCQFPLVNKGYLSKDFDVITYSASSTITMDEQITLAQSVFNSQIKPKLQGLKNISYSEQKQVYNSYWTYKYRYYFLYTIQDMEDYRLVFDFKLNNNGKGSGLTLTARVIKNSNIGDRYNEEGGLVAAIVSSYTLNNEYKYTGTWLPLIIQSSGSKRLAAIFGAYNKDSAHRNFQRVLILTTDVLEKPVAAQLKFDKTYSQGDGYGVYSVQQERDDTLNDDQSILNMYDQIEFIVELSGYVLCQPVLMYNIETFEYGYQLKDLYRIRTTNIPTTTCENFRIFEVNGIECLQLNADIFMAVKGDIV